MNNTLARLQRVDLRKAWKHEAGDFTPWLAQEDNLQMLAEALGLSELALVATEHPAGDFKIDLLCEDDEEGKVVIENQLARTDHSHLGQILTYAANVDARKVIWVAEAFRAEHLAALEFLNQHTTEKLNFFAVEVELWRIGDSPMAPSFNVVVKPNDWAKAGQQSARVATVMTPTKQLQLKFWTEWREWLHEKGSSVKVPKPQPQHWTTIAIGRAGFHLGATINTREQRLGMELHINHAASKAMFHRLHEQKAAIDAEFAGELEWMELPDGHACRIVHFRSNSPLGAESDWPIYFEWFETTAAKMSAVFKPRLKEL